MAVKVLSHEGNRAAKLNALHEAVVSAHVHHPNVVGISDLAPLAHATYSPSSIQKPH